MSRVRHQLYNVFSAFDYQDRQQAALASLNLGIDNFEKRLREFIRDVPLLSYGSELGGVIEPDAAHRSEQFLDNKGLKKFVVLKAPMDPLKHMKMLSRTLPDAGTMHQQTAEYLDKIRVYHKGTLNSYGC